MKKSFVIKCLIIVLVIIFWFVLSKIYHFMIVNKSFQKIQEFKEKTNRVYSVSIMANDNITLGVKIFLKDEIIKYVNQKNELELVCAWKNFENDEEYFINIYNREFYMKDTKIQNKNALPNLPGFILYAFKDDKLDITKIFDIYYIIPMNYNDKMCYKIVTKYETIIIDKETYLPVYSSMKMIKFTNETKDWIENTYEFKVGDVTDEDIALPDLSDYTVIE